MLHVNMKRNTYQQNIIHVVCCIMCVYVKTVEVQNKEVQKPSCRCPYKLRSYRLANNKIAREEKNNVKSLLNSRLTSLI